LQRFDRISIEPIGVVRSPFTTLAGMPLQAVAAQEIEGTVEIRPELTAGLDDLDGFSHIHLITWLHRAPLVSRLKLVPFLDDTPRGVLSTRSPERPNPIGLSVVRLPGVAGSTLEVAGVDLLDGTPVLDLKPFVPEFDVIHVERTGWLASRAADVHHRLSDDRSAIE
jgi:tRNA-Thr(GGU) m(6)t(6)A37 methyltransferase TsaA